MATTVLLKWGNAVAVDPTVGTELADLDVAEYRAVRMSFINGTDSTGALKIVIPHEMFPGTPGANVPTWLDTIRLAPGETVSKVYEVPGETIIVLAQPEDQGAQCSVFFTIYGRND